MNSDAAPHSADESVVLKTFEEYLIASISLDANRVAQYYDEPFMFVTAASSATVANRAAAEKFLSPGFAALREGGYARTEFPTLRSASLGKGLAIISGLGVRYKADGTQMASFGITYLWRQVPAGWKLAVMTVYDPSKVLQLEQPAR
ncbi:MAG: nuclear transport factor 2 family protein [Burkholderiaceae bacterium]|nr:nuclear transport factor 2 family protein [Burkholderiaceae bacterium]